MFKIIFTSPDGSEICTDWNKQDGQESICLASNRKAFFGRKGTINYTDLVATHNGSTLRVVRESEE
jgi:hypothetical protein